MKHGFMLGGGCLGWKCSLKNTKRGMREWKTDTQKPLLLNNSDDAVSVGKKKEEECVHCPDPQQSAYGMYHRYLYLADRRQSLSGVWYAH
jgi:hypothetical protein